MVNHRRSEFEIIENILMLSKNGVNKTKILYQGNLNFKITNKYLSYLLDNGLLKEKNNNGSGRLFFTTDKGYSMLGDISKFLDQFGRNGK